MPIIKFQEVNMEEKRGFGTRLEHFFTGKGFYIVLFLCIALIGVSAWIMLFSGNETDEAGTTAVFTTDTVASPPEIAEPPAIKPEITEPKIKQETTPVEHKEPKRETGEAEQHAIPEKEPEEVQASYTERSYIWPLSGGVSTGYSVDALVYSRTMDDWRTHDGIDIETRLGTKVLAISNGVVREVYNDDMYGTTVVIEHGEIVASYSNMASVPTVSAGDSVSRGDVIGSVGNTALAESADQPHLHLAVKKDGETADPLDYLPRKLG